MTTPVLDELDHKILSLLGEDARVSNRQIAADLGTTEGTVRARLKRLQQENLIRFSVVTDYRLEGTSNLALMWVHADPKDVRRLAKEIADLPTISSVLVTLGRASILATSLLQRLEDVVEIANNSILTLEGVRHVETSIVVRTLKYDYTMTKITRAG